MRFLLGLILTFCASIAFASDATLASLDWHPKLDQPIQQLEEVLAETEQQQPRNYTNANLAFLLDAKLYFLFGQHLASLPEAKRRSALDAQRRWLAERKAATDAAYAEYEGGTLASFAGSDAYIEKTKSRIAEIEKRGVGSDPASGLTIDDQTVPGVRPRSPADASAELLRLDREMEAAVLKGDVATLERICAPTFQVTHGDGKQQSRAELLGAVASGAMRFSLRDVSDQSVELHDDVALVLGRIHIRRDDPDPKRADYTISYVRVYQRIGGAWQLLSHRTTRSTAI